MKNINILIFTFLSLFLVACSDADGELDKDSLPVKLSKMQNTFAIQKVWQQKVGNGQGENYSLLEPVIFRNNIYTASNNGLLLAMNKQTGKLLWRKNIKKQISGGLNIEFGKIILSTLSGEVYAIDVKTGNTLWQKYIAKEVLAVAAQNQTTVFVQTQDDYLLALNAKDGEELWSYKDRSPNLSIRGNSGAKVYEDLVIAAFASGRVMAFDVRTGRTKWEQRLAYPTGKTEIARLSDIDGKLTIIDNTLFVAGFQGKLAALNVQNGQVLWNRDVSTTTNLTYDEPNIFVVESNSHISRIDDRTAAQIWTNSQLQNRKVVGGTIYKNLLVVADYRAFVHFIDIASGEIIAREKLDNSGVNVAPITDGNLLYIYTNKGLLQALTIN